MAKALLIVRLTMRLGYVDSSSQALGVPSMAELRICLVDHEHGARRKCRSGEPLGFDERHRRAGRVVRGRDEDDRGSALLDGIDRRIDVDGEVGAARQRRVRRERVARVLRVHRVGGLERERQPPRPAERQEDVMHHLVRAVGRPHLVDRYAHARLPGEVVRQRLTQRVGIAVGIAVQPLRRQAHGLADRRRYLVGQRKRVLVDVQAGGDVELGSAVGEHPHQVLAQRWGEVLDHVSPLRSRLLAA